ncbi:MAG: hypothetical protein ACK5S5_06005 [Planctomycetota bacterium]
MRMPPPSAAAHRFHPSGASMMSFAAAALACLLPLAAAAPQGGGDPAKPGLLTPAERSTLRDKLAKFMLEDAEYSTTTDKERDKAARAREKAKEAFDAEWRKAEKKGNVLASMPDIRGIFENCFLLKAPSKTVGTLWNEKSKLTQMEYSYYLPKTYKANVPHLSMWLLPGRATADPASAFAKASEYFSATWDKSPLAGEAIFHIPNPIAGMEFDPIPDFGREADDAEEQRRITWMWGTYAETLNAFNVDRGRLFLDCGRGNCGFGLRFVSMFPDRFAGVILREPVAVDGLRLGSMAGVPVLMIKTAATAAAVDALRQRIEELAAGSVTVIDAVGEYPHKDLAPKLEEWIRSKRRNPLPTKVVVEPNHDKFNNAFWVDIVVADRLVNAAADKKPRLECSADRAANRITVKSVGIERFTIFLNDDLVDLDKEFTIVVNEKAITEKRSRSFRDMRENVIVRSDWELLFPVRYNVAVPK